MDIRRKNFFSRLLCKHDHQEFTKNSMFHALNGERVYIICVKCGHEKGSYFLEYEGNGFK